jgi:NAD(P)-dependent dehydrogenase (short-subunit alcohol dehydrogenase family)
MKARKAKQFPRQRQSQPGHERPMKPKPESKGREYRAANKLERKVALITGGDSGIGRAVAVAFAKEGADVAIVYLEEHEDARETKRLVEAEGRRCILISGDVGDEDFCNRAVEETVKKLQRLNILVNNAAESPHLIDYSATKGAIVAFTRSLSKALVEKNIRVNAVAPGPIWTPLIPSTFPEDHIESFGAKVPMNRAGQPDECAPSYVFLASDDAAYMTGQVLHPNGGEVING